ncbi:hypothetical protein CAOG_03533 [Capsaspora owczarzaki ATCC 30864]|uniref:Prolyl endopeptidase-like n=1 Tax=Capsaspora owczarzaki (strain ATCC 30864) TaxID=595528 RepID=A0A0D2X2I3_CAPO3|nr:hypothetical protein CAOG_03533 [Capsaspora owczarzaki ATCC 30864]KJE92609.1 hypothetical protein, variant [Capsaspora owczarzaki ATCC 30864]|eukprot:XP_004348438.1 hypothetical protein CAOG_03533 [Capsaspora owczarzaki ATCC 30864]
MTAAMIKSGLQRYAVQLGRPLPSRTRIAGCRFLTTSTHALLPASNPNPLGYLCSPTQFQNLLKNEAKAVDAFLKGTRTNKTTFVQELEATVRDRHASPSWDCIGKFLYLLRQPGESLGWLPSASSTGGRAKLPTYVRQHCETGAIQPLLECGPDTGAPVSLALSPEQRLVAFLFPTRRAHCFNAKIFDLGWSSHSSSAVANAPAPRPTLVAELDNVHELVLGTLNDTVAGVPVFFTRATPSGRVDRLFVAAVPSQASPATNSTAFKPYAHLVYQETNPAFSIDLSRTHDARWICVRSGTRTLQHVWVVNGRTPIMLHPTTKQSRLQLVDITLNSSAVGREHYLSHRNDQFLLLTNSGANSENQVLFAPSPPASDEHEPIEGITMLLERQSSTKLLIEQSAPGFLWTEWLPKAAFHGASIVDIQVQDGQIVLFLSKRGRPAISIVSSVAAAADTTRQLHHFVPPHTHANHHLQQLATDRLLTFSSMKTGQFHIIWIHFDATIASVHQSKTPKNGELALRLRSAAIARDIEVGIAMWPAPKVIWAQPSWLSSSELAAMSTADNAGWMSRMSRFLHERYSLARNGPVPPSLDLDKFVSYSVRARSLDGTTMVPITLVHAIDVPLDQPVPLLATGYGAYGEDALDMFGRDEMTEALLRRGWILALCHVRGGGELGRTWYQAGRREGKPNSFLDFAGCILALQQRPLALTSNNPATRPPWCPADAPGTTPENCRLEYDSPSPVGTRSAPFTTPQMTALKGVSAGGLLVATTLLSFPGIAQSGILASAFVDPLAEMLDSTRTLSQREHDEWGNPLVDSSARKRIESFSPVTLADSSLASRLRQAQGLDVQHPLGYPYSHMLFTVGTRDTIVPFTQTLRLVAQLRAETAKNVGNATTPLLLCHVMPDQGHVVEGASAFVQTSSIELSFLTDCLSRVSG